MSYLEGQQIDAYVATGRQKHGTTPSVTAEVVIPDQATVRERMAAKLQSPNGKKVYSKRKEIVEPVFGQIKEARGLRRFLLRGLELGAGGVELDLYHPQPVEAVPERMEADVGGSRAVTEDAERPPKALEGAQTALQTPPKSPSAPFATCFANR